MRGETEELGNDIKDHTQAVEAAVNSTPGQRQKELQEDGSL